MGIMLSLNKVGQLVDLILARYSQRMIFMFIRNLIFSLSIFTSFLANAEDIFLICSVKGNWKTYGPPNHKNLPYGDISKDVLVTVGTLQNKPISLTIDGLEGFDNSRVFAYSPEELTVGETNLYIRKEFNEYISKWEQSASLHRITLNLKVRIGRVYIKPPKEGFFLNYSGTCRLTSKKI